MQWSTTIVRRHTENKQTKLQAITVSEDSVHVRFFNENVYKQPHSIIDALNKTVRKKNVFTLTLIAIKM